MRATERVEITSVGKVTADIFTPALCIEEGAFLEGHCSMESSALEGGRRKVAQMPLAKKHA